MRHGLYTGMIGMCAAMAMSSTAQAWYEGPWGAPWYQSAYPYNGYYWQNRYPRPEWQIRGRVNRYGDYQVQLRLHNIRRSDAYRMAYLFQLWQHSQGYR